MKGLNNSDLEFDLDFHNYLKVNIRISSENPGFVGRSFEDRTVLFNIFTYFLLEE